MTAFFNLGSLGIGLGAWALACLAVKSAVKSGASASHRLSVGSLGACAVSLLLQFLEISHRVDLGDFSAIADTIRSTVFAACALIAVTVFLNAAAVMLAAAQKK